MGAVTPVIASFADTFMTVMLVAVIVLGYVVIWWIWRTYFKGRTVEPNELQAEVMNRAGRDLAEELWEFELWLRKREPEAGWERILVTEVDVSSDPVPRTDAAVLPQEFASRFGEILRASQRDAIALEALRVDDGRLLVAVNWASEPKAGEPRRAPLPVTVRYHAADGLTAAPDEM